MGKYCSKCGTKLEDNEEFCSNCGASLKKDTSAKSQKNPSFDSKKLIFVAIGVIIILIAGVILLGGVVNSVPLEHADFEIFEMDVPEGSDFQIYKSFSNTIIYSNHGQYSEDMGGIAVSTEPFDDSIIGKLVESNENMKLYKVDENSFIGKNGGSDFSELVYQKDGLYFHLDGSNPALLKKVAETIELKST